ncbi:MAG: hypothetical protein ACLUIS_06385 [Longibaculum sp.]
MNVLKQNYDFIIVDCAPVGTISDAIPVGNAVDGTIFVVSLKIQNVKMLLIVLAYFKETMLMF